MSSDEIHRNYPSAIPARNVMTLDRNTDGTLLQTRIDAGTGMLVRVFHFIVKMLSEPHNTFITIH